MIKKTKGDKPPVINFWIAPKLLARVDRFRHRYQFPTRSSAIKWLIEEGLKKNLHPAKEEK